MDSGTSRVVGDIMISLFKIHHPKGVGKKIEEVFESGFITEGEYSDEFESVFQKFVDSQTVLMTNSGTSSLSLAYHLADVQPGDEVISSPMTCMATNEPIIHRGAKIVWADVDPNTGNICPKDVANKITDKTKAIVAVHWAGQPFDVDALMNFDRTVQADGYPAWYNDHIPVIEDAAHAIGAKYKGKPVGTVGDYGCFSFQAIKHLTTVDGGALYCKEESQYERGKKLRWFGLDRKYQGPKWEQDIPECGYKFHMNNINAVIGLEQMKYIDDIVQAHKDNCKFYDENISNGKVRVLDRPEWAETSSWIYSLLVDNPEEFKAHLNKHDIACDSVHVRNDTYSVFKDFDKGSLPGVDEFTKHMINIPVGWWLTNDEKYHIMETVNNY